MTRILILTIAIALAILTKPAAAQSRCAPYDAISANLIQKYGERRAHGGLRSTTQAMEIWVNDETGTWTVLIITPANVSCVVAAGAFWQDWKPGQPG